MTDTESDRNPEKHVKHLDDFRETLKFERKGFL